MARLGAVLLVGAMVAGAYAVGGGNGCDIKGNISSRGERIYHMPGQKYYASTSITFSRGERWFCSEREAKAAGWRRSHV